MVSNTQPTVPVLASVASQPNVSAVIQPSGYVDVKGVSSGIRAHVTGTQLDDTTLVGQENFNTHTTYLPKIDMVRGYHGFSLSHLDVDIDLEKLGDDESRFFTDPKEVHTPLPPDVVIDSFNSQRVTSSF